MDATGSTTIGVGAGVTGTDVGEPSLEEQAATKRTRSETAGQKKPTRRIREINIKKVHPKILESWTGFSNTYEQPPGADGIQVV